MLLPVGNRLIPYETPYHVVELFIQIIKQYFSDMPEEFPFKYIQDDFEKTGILVDTSYNKETQTRNSKPIIIVTRGLQQANVLAVGDNAALNFTNKEAEYRIKTNLVHSSIIAQVISKSRPEAEIVAQHVFSLFMNSRTLLNTFAGVHMIMGVSMAPAVHLEQDTERFSVTIEMPYEQQATWIYWKENTYLRELLLSQNVLDYKEKIINQRNSLQIEK